MAIKTASGSRLSGSLPAGLVLLNTTSFSGVSSQSINDVFSATYRYYRVVCDLTASSASESVSLRLRVGGSDASGSNYSFGGHESFVNNATFYASIQSNGTGFFLGRSNTHFGSSLDVRRPFLTEPTQFAYSTIRSDGTINSATGNGVHTLGTSYTGFTLIVASGTFSGSVSTFGYSV
jgi:hypothetical protein